MKAIWTVSIVADKFVLFREEFMYSELHVDYDELLSGIRLCAVAVEQGYGPICWAI